MNTFVCSHCGSTEIWCEALIDPNNDRNFVIDRLNEGYCGTCMGNHDFITQDEYNRRREEEKYDMMSDEDRGT